MERTLMDEHQKCQLGATLLRGDCIELFENIRDLSVDFTLTDIPYDVVNRKSNGLRNLDKGKADELRFDLEMFLENVLRVTKNSICIFCGKEQFSTVYQFFANQKGTVRPIVWKKNQSVTDEWTIYLLERR